MRKLEDEELDAVQGGRELDWQSTIDAAIAFTKKYGGTRQDLLARVQEKQNMLGFVFPNEAELLKVIQYIDSSW